MKKQQATSSLTPMISAPKSILAIGLLVLSLTTLSAEGGCSRFGHSCFGAHGKRGGGGGNVGMEQPGDSDPLTPLLIPENGGRMGDYEGGQRRRIPISPYFRDWILGMRRDGVPEEGRSKEFLSSGAERETRRK